MFNGFATNPNDEVHVRASTKEWKERNLVDMHNSLKFACNFSIQPKNLFTIPFRSSIDAQSLLVSKNTSNDYVIRISFIFVIILNGNSIRNI